MTDDAPAPQLDPVLQRLRAALVYGVATFAAGFVFGVAREAILIPLLGARAGRWVEFLIMIAACFLTASLALKQLQQRDRLDLVFTSVGGLVVLLGCESMFALYVMQVPLAEYLRGFDVTRGELFPWGLLTMALAPFFTKTLAPGNVGRKR